MKVQSIELKYFKKFRTQEFDFTDPETGLARDLIVLIGMNGAGKNQSFTSDRSYVRHCHRSFKKTL